MTLPPYVRRSKDGVVVEVFVQPRSAKDAIVGVHGEALKMKVRAAPVDGKANRAAAELLADAIGVAPSRVQLVAGATSRSKRLAVAGADADSVACELARVLSSCAHEPG